MASRPRRAAAKKANTAITDMVDSDNNTSVRPSRTMSSRQSSRRSEVKLPASKLRQATSSRQVSSSIASREGLVGGEVIEGKRARNQKKSYVLDSSEEEDEEEDDDAEGEEDDDEIEAAGPAADESDDEIIVNDTMDVDAEGEDDDLLDEDAEGEDDDMIDAPPTPPTIKVSRPTKSTSASKSKTTPLKSAMKPVIQARDSDDDELSELESEEDEEIQDTVKVGGGPNQLDEDVEGEEDDEIEAAGPADGVDDIDIDSDEDGSLAETPDLTKMTKRQRARFEDDDGGLMKLSDEVQAKKHFTAEELSMRRAEMARRRRNLSEKRNEEVKMETINKLLKKQAPKTKGKGRLNGDESPDHDGQKPSPVFVRWISRKEGSVVAVPDEMLAGPAGRVFIPGGLKSGKMVEEVS